MAITRKKKEETVALLVELFEDSLSVVATDNRGLSVDEMNQLRGQAREAGCKVKVAKNRLIKLALSNTRRVDIESYLVGPTLLVAHAEDPIIPAKLCVDFAKDHEKLEIKAGLLGENVMDTAGVNRLAKLPGLDQLRSQFAGMVNSLAGVVYFNAQNLMSQFSGLVDAQKDKLEKAA